MWRLLLIAARNLVLNRRRSLLLGGAIAVVTLLFLLMGSVGNGIQHTVMTAGTSLFSGHVNVGGFYKVSAGRAAPVIDHGEVVAQEIRDGFPEATLVVTRGRGFAKLVSERESAQSTLIGVNPIKDRPLVATLRMVRGEISSLAKPRTIVLFEAQAKKLKVDVGDPVTLTSPTVRGAYNSLDVTVGAIAEDMGILSIMSAFVSNDTIQELYMYGKDSAGWILVYLDDPSKADDAQAKIRTLLEDNDHRLLEETQGPYWGKFQMVTGEDWVGQKLDTTTWEDELMAMQWTLKVFDTVTGLLISILIVIIIVGVMNTLWITIRDRTREIGTLRAIGMGRFKVLTMFVFEVMLLSFVAGAVGVAMGTGLVALLNVIQIPVSRGFQLFVMADHLVLLLSTDTVLKALLLIPSLTTVASIFPALRAARMRPITAMHHAG